MTSMNETVALGDTVEAHVTLPRAMVLRTELLTPQAVAYANKVLRTQPGLLQVVRPSGHQ